ncbi:MAG: cation transporter [Clostridiales bacterium]|jgi:copper ion binding protein|nr:cation transporter [Clostridiales bacterium]
MTKTITIKGMSCNHCTNAVKKALEGLDGAKKVSVDLASGTAVVKSDTPLSDDAIRAAIAEEGFTVTAIKE